jgi:hypothetical protein
MALTKRLPPLRSTKGNSARFATILFYAQARWGKTYSIRTLPGAPGRVLVLATELGDTQGLQTLSDLDIPFLEIDTDETLDAVIAELSRDPTKCTYEGQEFESIALDSLTACAELWVEHGLRIKHWTALWDELGEGTKDPRMVYAFLAERGRQVVKAMMRIPAHLLMICREGVQEEGEGRSKTIFCAPELPGQKLPRELPGWPDATLHGVTVNGKRLLRTRTYAKAVAGIRLPGDLSLPELVKPDFGAICRLMLDDRAALKDLVEEKSVAPTPGLRPRTGPQSRVQPSANSARAAGSGPTSSRA